MPAGRVVIIGALVLGVGLLFLGFAAAAVTCAVTAGVLWLLLQIPDEPEDGDALPPPVWPERSSADANVQLSPATPTRFLQKSGGDGSSPMSTGGRSDPRRGTAARQGDPRGRARVGGDRREAVAHHGIARSYEEAREGLAMAVRLRLNSP